MSDAGHVAAGRVKARRLEDAGATVLALPDAAIDAAFAALGRMGLQSVLLEGGPACTGQPWRRAS